MRRIILGGRLLSFLCFPDFSFRDVWSGIFFLDEKIANYIAVKTKHGWAAPENAIVEKTLETCNSITYRHNINGSNVEIKISLEDDNMSIHVNGSNINVLEMGICHRHAYGNACKSNVRVKEHTIDAGKIRIDISGGSVASVEERTHEQGGKNFHITVVRIPFVEKLEFSFHHPLRMIPRGKNRKTSFRSDSAKWNTLYSSAKRTIEMLTKRRGWYAGLPWFVQYWARDTFLSVPALVREGYAHLVKRTLLDFLYSKVDGEIPRLIREDGTPEFGSIDANPLFLNAVADYVRISGDYAFIQENRQDLLEAYYWIVTEFPDYTVKSYGKDTWMDTLETRRYPVEVQAFAMEAARKLDWLGLTNGEYPKFKEAFETEKRKFLLERSANVLLASMYGLINPNEAITLAERWKLVGENGVKTLSPDDADYDPKGYHTGAVWGLTTGAGIYVALLAERYDIEEKLSRGMVERIGKTGYLDEVWNAENGEPMGADAQLWSASMIIRAIDEVIVRKKRMPEDIATIKRVWWEKGYMRHATIPRNNH